MKKKVQHILILFILFILLKSVYAISCPTGNFKVTLGDTSSPYYPNICLENDSVYVAEIDRRVKSDGSIPGNDQWAYENPSVSCDLNYCGDSGFYYIDSDLNEHNKNLTLVPEISMNGTYNVTIFYRIGNCSAFPSQSNENFSVSCGNDNYFFPDDKRANGVQFRNITFSCNFNEGFNNITFHHLMPGTTTQNSIHFEMINIEGCFLTPSTSSPTNIFPFFTLSNLISVVLAILFIYSFIYLKRKF